MVSDVTDASAKGDLFNILPPAAVTEILSSSVESNKKTQTTFNQLLRTPFLQEIHAGGLQIEGHTAGTPVLPIISDGLTHFSASQITDVGIARKLAGYASIVPQLAAYMPRGRVAEALIGMVTRYADFANKKSVESKQFYTSFQASITSISSAIDNLDADMEILRTDISNIKESTPITGSEMLANVKRRLGKYLSLDANSEESLISTLALIFSVGTEELSKIVYGSQSGPDVTKFLEFLKDFQTRLRDVRILMTALMQNLTAVMRQSISLMGAWYEILQNLNSLKATSIPLENFNSGEVSAIKSAWGVLKSNAEEFTKAVSDVSSTSVTSVLERNTEVVRRSLAFATRSTVTSARSVSRDVNMSDAEKEAISKITTDEQTKKSLDAMTATSGKIVASFNKLLRVPFLDSLHVSSAASSGTNADGTQAKSTDESKKIDLETLTLNYLKRYQKLQADTVPIARNLYGYARVQQQLIPLLGKSLTVDNYVRANLSIIEKRRQEAEEVHALHNKFQQDWNLAILLVERAIREQEENIKGIEATIEDLVKQHKKMTMGAIFSFIGAALFTAAAFMTGGLLMVAAGSVAIGLVVTGSVLASKAAEIQNAINGYRKALNSAKETLSQLEFVLPVMQEIGAHLSAVTLIWNDIANKLAELHTGTEIWETLALILQEDDEWKPLKAAALENWKGVETSVLAYVAQVSDVNPNIE